MGYHVVVSLKQTIMRLLHSSIFSVDSHAQQRLRIAYNDAESLQELLIKTLDNRGGGGQRLHTLEAQIGEAVRKLEDFLELHVSDVFLDQNNLSIEPDRVKEEITRFAERAKQLGEEDYEEEDVEADADASATASASNTGFGEEMVGFSDELTYMKYYVRSVMRPVDCGVLSIVGATGTGRSLAVKKVFDECLELEFECCVWVSVGPIYQHDEILQLILAQLLTTEKMAILSQLLTKKSSGWGDEEMGIFSKVLTTEHGWGGEKMATLSGILKSDQGWGDEEMRKKCVWLRLAWRKYMIVLDDVCDARILDLLLPIFPMQNNGSAVLVTTGSMRIAMHARPFSIYRVDDIHRDYADQFWDIFRYVLFKLQPIPPELEEAGRKIAGNCRGRGLCMSKVLLYLWSADRSRETWNEIASNPHHPLFNIVDESSEIQKIQEDFANLTTESAKDTAILSPFVLDNGISVTVEFIKKLLFPERFFPKMEVISFVGTAGIGKTTFVKKIFEYLQNLDGFEPRPRFCVWLTLGPKYESEDILIDILAQVFPRFNKEQMKGNAELTNYLCRESSDIRFVIVLDDVWNEAPLRNLAKLYPNIKGRALVTTRFAQVAQSKMIDITREIRFLSKEESWDLLRQKVFGQGCPCPYELEKAGKKIAENCDGLPLTIVEVAKLISKDLSPQYWSDVANKNSDFMNALEELSEALLSCYDSLPLYLRPCFLYMGVFQQNHEVSTTKVVKLWIAEGFLESNSSKRGEDFAKQCLLELVNRNLVMVSHKSSSGYGVKTCRLNSVFWHLSNRVAMQTKFFHACDSVEGVKNQRRFCIRNCILLSIKHIHDWMMESIETARSLVCTGPYHHYQVPFCYQLRLLRVVDALVIRFYEFPDEVVKLIHLRHLAITCDGNLPTSISKLWNLQFLIVNRHLRINSSGDSSSYLPMEIWDMKELRHLQVTGSSLPTPSRGTTLPNLVTLLDVSTHDCTKEVLGAIPNLEKLGVQIELAPGDAPFLHHLNHISSILTKLESLKCVVVNPEMGFEVVVPPPPVWMFPSSVVKLSLSGLGYPWEYMDIIGKLENLQVLKLQCYAFRGEKWDTGDYAFRNLVHLVIEDTDLVCWKTTTFSFSKLRHLSIKHCYNLETLPYDFVGNKMIQVIDCNPCAVKWANQMKERNGFRTTPTAADRVLEVALESSWDDGQPRYRRKTPHETPYDRYISSTIDNGAQDI